MKSRSPQFFASGGTREVTCGNVTPWSNDAATTGYHCPPLASMNAAYTVAKRSEEHTSELQSQFHLVCRLLLEKKKKIKTQHKYTSEETYHTQPLRRRR